MNDSTIAFRAKEQLGKFLGKVFTHFSRPRQKFLADMLYGIQASGDTQLSSVMRAINDDSEKCHAVEKRLSRNVAGETVGDEIDKAILEAGAKFVRDDTLILVDPTEIRWLASQCVMRHNHHVKFDSHGKECNVQVEFGAMPARLPMHPEKELHMVVVKGFGEEPMMLLTSLPVNGSFESMWRIVEGYLTRWRIEETIRFVKQAYGFENVRVHSYRGIRNMASIVLATAYFASVWLGRHVKREVLAEHLANLSQRLKEVPEFANYAIAEGLKRAFTRFGKFCRKIIDPEPDPEPSVIYQTLPGLEKFFNPDLC